MWKKERLGTSGESACGYAHALTGRDYVRSVRLIEQLIPGTQLCKLRSMSNGRDCRQRGKAKCDSTTTTKAVMKKQHVLSGQGEEHTGGVLRYYRGSPSFFRGSSLEELHANLIRKMTSAEIKLLPDEKSQGPSIQKRHLFFETRLTFRRFGVNKALRSETKTQKCATPLLS